MLHIAITKAVPVTKNHSLCGDIRLFIKRVNNQLTGIMAMTRKKLDKRRRMVQIYDLITRGGDHPAL